MQRKHIYVLFVEQSCCGVGRRAEIEKSSLFRRFLYPCVVVAVAVENYALMLFHRVFDDFVKSALKIACYFKYVGILTQRLGDCGVEHNVCVGYAV